ncbi:hypothetical protein LTR94_024540 [Friedmanniomyces endolithicus]|nr:hypothetical protein LTR94_024540 [Friedmanniomyces endolithicus]
MRLISIAQSNSQRLVRLINDILDIEKLESGQMTLDISPLDLREIAVRSLDSVRGFADNVGVTLELIEGPPGPVMGDADRLVQVVVNLLSNAIKFSPSKGQVCVNVMPEARIVRLSVKDNGPGVPETFRARIFSKFAQADGSDTRQKGGTGLGLAIAREIAERHGGRLWFESAAGEGATFHLDIPLAIARPTETQIDGPRLLIVEDDADAAEVLRIMLDQDGFDAQIVGSASEALQAINHEKFAAVLVDLQLPDADGIGLIRSLRARADTLDIPVVVVSADVARGKARGRSLEVLDWLEKPFDQNRLRLAITAILKRLNVGRPVVLHVDDDPDILMVTAATLGEIADVRAADSLLSARAALANWRPDLIILDLGLPDGSGLELLPELSDPERDPIPVVVYSAQEMDAVLGDKVEAVLVKSSASLTDLTRTLMHVDDEPDIREVAAIALQLDPDIALVSAPSGQDALDMLANGENPDVILLDVMMPKLDGPGVLARLKAEEATRAIPVVFMTARAQSHEIDKLRSLGAVGVIIKPFDPMTLARQVKDLLAEARGMAGAAGIFGFADIGAAAMAIDTCYADGGLPSETMVAALIETVRSHS